MFGIFNLGLQEMLVLAFCCGAPLIAGGVTLLVVLLTRPKERPRDDDPIRRGED